MNLIAILLFAIALPAQKTDAAGDHDDHRHLEAAQAKNPVSPGAESVANGGKLYSRSCATCHGKEGKGDPPPHPPYRSNGRA